MHREIRGVADLLMNQHRLFLGLHPLFFLCCMHDPTLGSMYFVNGRRGWGAFMPSC